MSQTESTQATTVDVPTSNTSSGGKVTADDLLEMYDQEVIDKQDEVSQEVEKQAAVAAELPKKLIANKIAKKLTDKHLKDSNESQITEGLTEDQSEVESEEEKEVVVPEVPIKSFKAKHGDKELDIPEEAAIISEINGKPLQVKVKDAIKSYVGQEKWNRELDRRINYVSSREKGVETQVENIKVKFREMAELAGQGDHLAAIKVMAEMSGKDPVEYERSVLQTLDKINQVFVGMTPEQREAYFANRKAEHLLSKNKELEAKFQNSQELTAVHQRVLSLCEENGISEQQFASHFRTLTSELGFDPKALQAEDVVAHHHAVNHAVKVGNAIRLVDPSLADDDFLVDELIKDTRNNSDLTEEDIAKIIRDVVGVDSQSVQNLNRKVEKANSNGLRSQAIQGSSNGKKMVKADDYDQELYEEWFGRRPVVTRNY